MPLNRVNWGKLRSRRNRRVLDNFRNNDVFKDRETRYQKLMNKVIRAGVKTKVLMLSATPVNNRFTDLRNQLVLAYEGELEVLSRNLKTKTSIEEIFRRAQKAFNEWTLLPPDERTAASILKALDFDFFERTRCGHHRSVTEAYRDLLRHQRHRKIPRTAEAAVVSSPDHRTRRRDGLQRHFPPAVGAQTRRLCADQLHPAEPAAEIRGNLRHAG